MTHSTAQERFAMDVTSDCSAKSRSVSVGDCWEQRCHSPFHVCYGNASDCLAKCRSVSVGDRWEQGCHSSFHACEKAHCCHLMGSNIYSNLRKYEGVRAAAFFLSALQHTSVLLHSPCIFTPQSSPSTSQHTSMPLCFGTPVFGHIQHQ